VDVLGSANVHATCGLAAINTLAGRDSSRANTTFWRLPRRRLLAGVSRDGVLTWEGLDELVANWAMTRRNRNALLAENGFCDSRAGIVFSARKSSGSCHPSSAPRM